MQLSHGEEESAEAAVVQGGRKKKQQSSISLQEELQRLLSPGLQ